MLAKTFTAWNAVPSGRRERGVEAAAQVAVGCAECSGVAPKLLVVGAVGLGAIVAVLMYSIIESPGGSGIGLPM